MSIYKKYTVTCKKSFEFSMSFATALRILFAPENNTIGQILVSLRTLLRHLAHALLYFALLMLISAIMWQLKSCEKH